MITNYVKTSLRKFRRSKAHTLINVTGLTLGLLCAVIIFQKVRYELSFDTHHPDADRIYRIVRHDTQFGADDYDQGVPYPLVPAFRNDFPEAEAVTIVDRNIPDPVIAVPNEQSEPDRYQEVDNVAFVQPDFFDIFHYDWLQGSPENALYAPRSVVLSESLARKYFGSADPIGQLITFNNWIDLTVTGVVADPPANTALPLHMLISFNLGEEHDRSNDDWGSTASSVQCYVKLAPGVTTASVNRKLPDFLERHRSAEVADYLTYFLQPLSDLHFDDRFGELGGHTIITREVIWALSLIGLFLLLTACINFINLNTVLVFKRAKEVGIRKVMGGTPGQIVSYFLTETGLITVIALVLALLLANPVMEATRLFIGEGFSANPFADPVLALVTLGTAAVLTVFSGLYPALLLARLQPTVAIRETTGQRPGAFLSLRRTLVVLQFAISQFLIICTLGAMMQMQYFYSAPLGYETDAVIEFGVPERDVPTLETLKNKLLQTTAIRHVNFSNTGASSNNTWGANFYYHKDDERLENDTQVKLVGPDYLDTYQISLIAGTGFTPSDTIASYIVNEAFVDVMGFETPEDALGTLVETWGHGAPIVGVVQDFNTNSLHQAIEPTILVPRKDYAFFGVGAAKVNPTQLSQALVAIEGAWTEAFPDYLFEYTFLDDRIAQFYEKERTFQRLIQSFALIAILIGCIGLFGLISYATSQRVKEVGIRKVLGASIGHIVGLFTREFVVLVVLGFVVSAPVAYYVMNGWLEDFAYRIDLGAGLFMAGFIVSLLIALATVGYKTYRAAVANPVDAIRQNG